MSTSLVLHRGARLVTRADLESFEAPPPEGKWFPLKHSKVPRTLGAANSARRQEGNSAGLEGQADFTSPDRSSDLIFYVASAANSFPAP